MAAKAQVDAADAVPGFAPDTARQAVRAIGLAQVGLGYLVASFGPYLAGLSDELGRPRGELVWLTSTFGAGLVLAALSGPAVLRLGAGKILRVACLAMAIGAIAMALSSHLVLAGAGSVLVGLAGAAITLVTPSLLRGPGAAKRFAVAVGIASAAGVSAPLAFGALESAGLPGRLAILGPVAALLVVTFRSSVRAPVEAVADHSKVPLRPAALGGLRIVLGVACEFCFVVWAVARLVDTGVSLGTASALGAGFGIGMAAGRLVGPRFIDRSWAITAAAVTTMAGTAIVYLGQDPATVTVGIVVASLGIALLYPITLAQLVSIPDLSARHSSSIASLSSGIAILAAPAALGWLDTQIGLREAFLLPIPLLALLLVLMPAKRTGVGLGRRLPLRLDEAGDRDDGQHPEHDDKA